MTKDAITEPRPDSDQPDDSNRLTPGLPAPKEIGGRAQGLEPTRYGDWEKNGRCIDF